MITDGLSNTIFVGEKHVPRNLWGQGWLDCSTYNGDYYQCSCRPAGPDYPLAKSPDEISWTFGSYHWQTVQFLFGDGRVQVLSVDVDPAILGLLAQRDDGQVIPDY